MEIKNVVLAGASGSLGKVILEALIATNKYTITLLTRKDSTATFPSSVHAKQINYDSIEDLTTALTDQDAVISAVGITALDTQEPLIRAAIAAGVRRFIPSDFSSNFSNPLASTLPQYAPQLRINALLQDLVQHHPEFSYTSIRNGPFLDWGLAMGFQVNLRSETPAFYDGGDRRFSTTTLSTVARAVVAVLDIKNLEQTRNRVVSVHDVITTQRHLLDIARKVAPQRNWDPVSVSTEGMERVARENYARGERDLGSLMGLFVMAVFGEGYGGCFERVDNDMLGVGGLDEEGLEGVVRGVLDSFE
ncbi:aromatic alcohol reductase [Aspergillus stella-maris]|uniref:aromatic alcohol reductase n=1 Tax=Aspergillus stella-maris TaxID=1810926 RepID=UPI003CCE503D